LYTWGKSRLFQRCGLVAFLGLSVCVFAWGLQYKLSLYDVDRTDLHQIPQAKLLSKNEQTSATEGPLVIRTKTSTKVIYIVPTAIFFVLLLAFRVSDPRTSGRRAERTSDLWRLRNGLVTIFFVRPPPILV
jgi:hypothetical protein